MTDLDQLERLAREARKDGDWFPSDFGRGALLPEDADYIAACSPDQVLRLVAIARAAEEFVDARESFNSSVYRAALAALRAALSPEKERG